MRKQTCIARILGLAGGMLLLALLGAVLLYGVTVYQCWQLKPTGSKLYDRFAQAVRGKQAPALYGGFAPAAELLPPAAAKAWEAQYKDEAQYWQLRYWLGLSAEAQQREAQARLRRQREPGTLPYDPTKRLEDGTVMTPAKHRRKLADARILPKELLAPLQTAVDSGVADAGTYLLLYEGELAAMDPAATIEQRAPMLALLDRSLDMHPENSWGWYLRALHRIDALHGEPVDWVAVRADLAAGNKAQRNSRPLAFPHSYVETELANAGAPAGNAVLAGAVLDYSARANALIPLAATATRATRLLLAQCAEADDPQLAGEYMRGLCRMAAMGEATPEDKLALSAPLRMVAYYLSTRVKTPPSWEQREDVFEVAQWLSDAPFVARLVCQEVEALRLYRSRELQLLPLSDRLAPPRLANVQIVEPAGLLQPARLRLEFGLRLLAREELFDKFNRLLANLGRFDWATLRLPYDLSPANRPKRLPPRIPTVEEAREWYKQQAEGEAQPEGQGKPESPPAPAPTP